MSARERLDEIEARANAATAGPWHIAKTGEIDAGEYDTVIGRGPVDCMSYCYGGSSTFEGDNLDVDREFIAAARQDVPALVAALRAVLDVLDGPTGTRDEGGRGDEQPGWIRGNRHMRVAVRRAVDEALDGPR